MKRKLRPFEIDIDALGYYINRAFFAMVKYLNQELSDSNLNLQHSDFTILKILNQIKAGSQTEISTILGKERSGISRSLSNLERNGYVKREAKNGSTNYVSLTPKGEEVLPKINAITDKVTEKAFKGFSQKSREAMIKNLNKIYFNSLEKN